MKPLSVNSRGQVVLRIVDGAGEEVAFPLGVDTTVAAALDIIRAENGLHGVELRVRRRADDDVLGPILQPLATVGDIASTGFEVVIPSNDQTAATTTAAGAAPPLVEPVRALPWVPTRAETQGGALTLEEVVRRGSYLRVTKALRLRPERTLTVAQFLNLAADAGVPPDEGRELLRTLHRAGVVLWFHRHPSREVADTVFLKPDEVLDALYAHFGLEGPNRAFVREQRERRTADLDRLHARLADRKAAKALVDREASAWAAWTNRAGFIALTSGFAGYAWLTFEYLSWDIVEPITYFTGVGFSIAAYFWWLYSSKRLRFETFTRFIIDWRRRDLYRSVLRDSAARVGDSNLSLASPVDPARAYNADIERLTTAILEVCCPLGVRMCCVTHVHSQDWVIGWLAGGGGARLAGPHVVQPGTARLFRCRWDRSTHPTSPSWQCF